MENIGQIIGIIFLSVFLTIIAIFNILAEIIVDDEEPLILIRLMITLALIIGTAWIVMIMLG